MQLIKWNVLKLLQPCHSDNMQKQILFQCIAKSTEHIKNTTDVHLLACDWFNLLPPPTGK
jgi:hypothetical protein